MHELHPYYRRYDSIREARAEAAGDTARSPAGWLVQGAEAYRLFAEEADAREFAGEWGVVRPVYTSARAAPDMLAASKMVLQPLLDAIQRLLEDDVAIQELVSGAASTDGVSPHKSIDKAVRATFAKAEGR